MDFVLTTEAIREGFENLKPSSNYDNLYYAGFSSHWTGYGMNATRLYTVNMVDTNKYCLWDECKTLAMVVDRFAAIENFKPALLGVTDFI
jgi:DNA topoisomerase-3